MANNRDFPAPAKVQEKKQEVQSADLYDAALPEEKVVKPKKGIEVVALRPGFYKKIRRGAGAIFMIEKMEQLGSWMKIVDEKLEAQRQKAEKESKSAGR